MIWNFPIKELTARTSTENFLQPKDRLMWEMHGNSISILPYWDKNLSGTRGIVCLMYLVLNF